MINFGCTTKLNENITSIFHYNKYQSPHRPSGRPLQLGLVEFLESFFLFYFFSESFKIFFVHFFLSF